MRKDFHTMGIWILILIVVIGCTGCIQQKEYGEMYRTEDFFRGEFSVKGEPALNQEVELIFTITPIEDSFDTGIWIYLPEGIELIQGDTEWEGDLKKDELLQVRIIVKPIQEGQLEIWSQVLGDVSGAERDWAYYIYFLTSKSNGQISRKPFYHEPHPVEGESKGIPIDFGLRAPLFVDVGEEIVLTFSLIAEEDMKNVTAVVELPEEFIFIDGVLNWTGDLKKEQEVTFQATIKPTKEGRFQVLGIVKYDSNEVGFEYDIFVS
jgi:hypothetical protein